MAARKTKPRINSRAKGAGAEREFAKLVFEHLGVELVRNLEQSRGGGHDLIAKGEDPVSVALNAFAIEVKRYATITPAILEGFWDQAERQAERAAKIPVLAYRVDRQEWRLVLPLYTLGGEAFQSWAGIGWTATVSVDAFACLVRERAQ
jgi:Holliday junction resolvase